MLAWDGEVGEVARRERERPAGGVEGWCEESNEAIAGGRLGGGVQECRLGCIAEGEELRLVLESGEGSRAVWTEEEWKLSDECML